MSSFPIQKGLALALIVAMGSTVSSCASFKGSSSEQNAKEAIAGEEDNYRDTEESLSQSLEYPPNLIQPQNQNSDVIQLLDPTASKLNQDYQTIPVRQFNGVKVRTNLSERWIEIPTKDTKKVWRDVQSFLISLGFEVKQKDTVLGILRTGYKPRSELAPVDTQGPLTRLLNSWRPEQVEGVYDRLTARIEQNEAGDKVRLYFYDHVIYQQNDGDVDTWKVRPYSPEVEAEALYQAMVFLGVSQNDAFKQIKVTEHLITDAYQTDDSRKDGKVLEGVLLHAPYEVSWTFVKAMLYRVGWTIQSVDEGRHQITVKVPKSLQGEQKGFLSRLFSQKDDVTLPEQMIIELQPYEKAASEKEVSADTKPVQILKLYATDKDSPLTVQQKRKALQSLGLLPSTQTLR